MMRFWRAGRSAGRPTKKQKVDYWNLEGYGAWIERYETLDPADRRWIQAQLARLEFTPLISILMPAYETNSAFLREAIASVTAQLYTNWELCVVDDASPSPHVSGILAEAAAKDSRIKWSRRPVNGHIAAASNSALALATGAFVALMDHDDLLSETALFEVGLELDRNREADIVYSDEDKLDAQGVRYEPYLKGRWNPELFYGHNMLSHFCVFRRSLLDEIGGFRVGLEGSQDYDLSLRAVARTTPQKIRHVPSVLYHWRASESQFSQSQLDKCVAAACKAKADFFRTRGEFVEVTANPMLESWERVRRIIPKPDPIVTLVVPRSGQPWHLERFIENVTKGGNDHIELIVEGGRRQRRAIEKYAKANHSIQVRQRLRSTPRETWMNEAAASAQGRIIGFVSAELHIVDATWLNELCALALCPENGVIGPKILAHDDTILQAGYALSPEEIAVALYRGVSDYDEGYFGRLHVTTGVSAVSMSCLFVRKSVFERVGGFDAGIPSFADIDLCLKVADLGLVNVWTPFARLKADPRIEARSWQQRVRLRADAKRMNERWHPQLSAETFHSPNLAFDMSGPTLLAHPPRTLKPWKC